MPIITVYNQKGGVGKSKTAESLCVGLAEKGFKVLGIDLDPQANLTNMFIDKENIFSEQVMNEVINNRVSNPISEEEALKSLEDILFKNDELTNTIYDVFKNPSLIASTIIQTEFDNLSLIPSSIALVDIDDYLAVQRDRPRERVLKIALAYIDNNYDFIIIDCPPAANNLTLNAIFASQMVFIPIKPSREATEGFLRTVSTINKLNTVFGANADWRVLITMVNRLKLSNVYLNMLKQLLGYRVFKQTIRTGNMTATYSSFNKDILLHCKDTNVVNDYKAFIDEITTNN